MSSESEMMERVRLTLLRSLKETVTSLHDYGNGSVSIDGDIDLEILARAAIEAVREYGNEVGTRRMWQELFPPPPEMSALREPAEAQRKCPHARKELHHDTQTGNYYRCLDCQLEWGEFEQLSGAALTK